MAFIALVGGVRVVINGLWNGQVTQNTLYFQTEGLTDPTAVEVNALANQIDDWFSSSILPNLNESFSYISVEATAINVGFGWQATAAANAGPGGVTGESMPNNVNPCISFRGAQVGRLSRGRNYVPGISTSDVLGNEIDADWMLQIASGYNELTSAGAFDPPGFNWVVASFFLNGAPRGAAVATQITTVLFTDNIVDSQRRRLPGRGR